MFPSSLSGSSPGEGFYRGDDSTDSSDEEFICL